MNAFSGVSRRKTLSALVVILMTISLVLAGCGSKPATAPSGGGSADGGTVTIPIAADPTFNPWHPSAYVESVFIYRVLFDGLTKPGLDGAPAPDLATSWEPAADGLSWTFHLRSGVKWHDGQPFTADDVAYTFNNIVLDQKLGANGRGNFKSVTKVDAPDPSTVVFHLSHPTASLPAYLAYNAGILPKHIFEGQDPWKLNSFNKQNPVGTGPFKMGKYVSGQSVELVANPDYWGGAPKISRLVFKVVPDANAQIAQLMSGDLSILTLDNKASVDKLKDDKNLVVKPEAMTQFYWLALHATNPLFQDVKVRQAIEYSLDRQSMINTIDKGYDTIANAPIAPTLQTYYSTDVTNYGYDVNKAKDLLAQAGWKDTNGDGILEKNGKPFHFVLDIAQKGNLVPVAQMVQQYLKAVGIDAQLNVVDWNTLIQKDIIKRDYDATINWWVYANDPDVLSFFHSSGVKTGSNIPDYQDPKLDQLLEKGQSTSDPAQRKQVYADLQKYMSDTLPYNFLWYPQELQVRSAKLQGVPDLNLRDAMNYVDQWSLSK